jgi:agmatinase
METAFDPNSTASADSGIFGLPFTADNSRLYIIPVPWEVTTSYGDGAGRGPDAVLRASHQVDLFDIETGDAYMNGYWLMPVSEDIAVEGRDLKRLAKNVVAAIEEGHEDDPEPTRLREEINKASLMVNDWVYQNAKAALAQGKVAAVLGGDHSTPFGLIKAVSESCDGDFGILHVDAHADLRDAYQGYKHSHASIMFNVMEQIRPKKLVQVGIRDFSPGEYDYIQKNASRVQTYFDPLTKRRLNKGESWQAICNEIVAHLPQNVHISFDIDGLSPDLCPSTGTPVPGGLSFDQALTLFATVAETGRRIIGFDLTEVAEAEHPESDWDGNVGARLLFKLCGWTAVTNGWSKAFTGAR